MNSDSALRASLALRLIAWSTLAGAATASDYYVDVVHGNNANTGTASNSAWQTLTFASTATPAGASNTIHVAPGVYDAASGETFPLVFHQQHLVGDRGARETFVDGGGTSTALIQMSSAPGLAATLTEVRGLSFRNASSAITAATSFNSIAASIADVLVSGMSAAALRGSANSVPSGSSVHFDLTRVGISSSAAALALSSVTGTSSVTASDCSFDTCTTDAIQLSPTSSSITCTLARCRFGQNAGVAVRGSATGIGGATAQLDVTFDDCLMWSNASGFSDVQPFDSNGYVTATFRRCTIADNVDAGIRSTNAGPGSTSSVALNSTLVWGNGVDLDATNVTSTAFSQIGGPDPLFIAPSIGNYGLQFLSPCVDTGDPAIPNGTLDLASVPRPIDGNLDTTERADIGALEFQPLSLVSSAHIGGALFGVTWGPDPSSRITLFYSRLAPVSPSSTPFGELDLNPSSIVHLIGPVGIGGPTSSSTIGLPIPNNPLLIGRTFSFQGLTESSAAPHGLAYTNVVWATIVP